MSRQSSFVYNFFLIIVLNLLIKIYWAFFVEVKVQNIFPADVYGIYFTFFQYSFIFMAVADAGIASVSNRILSARPERLSYYTLNLFVAKLMLAVVTIAGMFITGLALGYGGDDIYLLLLLGLNIVLITFCTYFRSNITAMHLFTTESFMSVLDKLIMGIICSFFLWVDFFKAYFDIYIFTLIQTFGYLITAIACFFVLKPQMNFTNVKVSFMFLKKFLKTSFPYALLLALMAMYLRTDTIILERLLPDGKYQAGIYARAFRLVDALNMFGVLMAGLLLPIFSRLIHRKENSSGIIKKAFVIVLFPVIFLPLSIFTYHNEVYDFLFPNKSDNNAIEVFIITMLCFVPSTLSYIFGTFITAAGRIRFLLILSVIALGISLIGNFILVPEYKILGTAVMSLTTQSFVLFGQIVYCIKRYKLKVSSEFFWRLFLLVGAAAPIYFIKNLHLPMILGGAVIFFCVAALFLVTGVFRINEVKELFVKNDKSVQQ